jgi:epoxide hydrolase 4
MAVRPDLDDAGVMHEFAEVNGVRLHYARAGEGPLIVFLHGFPQCWYQYRHQLVESSRDHLVVAPDLRGDNLSSKPEDVHSYLTCSLVEDVRQLVQHLGYNDFLLSGHDVGSAVAWSFALHHPDMLRALLILDGPHPAVFDRALHEDPDQREASSYMWLARQADAAELASADDFTVLREALNEPFFVDEDLEVYVKCWLEPGSLAGALKWFRAEGIGPESPDGTPARGNIVPHISPMTVNVPTLVIYPTADKWIRPASHQGIERYVPDLTFIPVQGASHWIAEEHPELVKRYFREYLESLPPSASVAAAPTRGRPGGW